MSLNLKDIQIVNIDLSKDFNKNLLDSSKRVPCLVFKNTSHKELLPWVNHNIDAILKCHDNTFFFWVRKKPDNAVDTLTFNDYPVSVGYVETDELLQAELISLQEVMDSAKIVYSPKVKESNELYEKHYKVQSMSDVEYLNFILRSYTTGTPEI